AANVCTVEPPNIVDVTAEFTRFPGNFVFVTTTKYNGNLGGLEGADEKCSTAASLASLGGTYVAFLSTRTMNARDRLGSARGFTRTDGLPIADTISDLLDEHRIWYAADLTDGNKPSMDNQAWTGSTVYGQASTDDCAGWTRGDAAAAAQIGQVHGGPNLANVGRVGCDAMNVLFCFETDRDEPLPAPQKQTGKLVFLSMGGFMPTMGLAGADDICNAEKPGGTSGPGQFVALLATSTRSAKSLLTGTYVRADGIAIDFFGPFGDASLTTGVWVHGDGSYAVAPREESPIRIWNGSQAFGAVPVPAAHTCGDWSVSTGMGDIGFASAGAPAWGANKANCTAALSLYCAEK